jgi:hypothetical protein
MHKIAKNEIGFINVNKFIKKYSKAIIYPLWQSTCNFIGEPLKEALSNI